MLAGVLYNRGVATTSSTVISRRLEEILTTLIYSLEGRQVIRKPLRWRYLRCEHVMIMCIDTLESTIPASS